MSFSEGPRDAVVTADDRGALIDVAAWTLMCTTVIFTAFRMVSNWALRRTLAWDDGLIVIGTVLAIAQSIAISIAVKFGAGRRQESLSASDIDALQQAVLATRILYLSTVAFGKLSLLYMLTRLLPPTKHPLKMVIKVTVALTVAYLVAGVLVLSFACSLPKTYDTFNGQCVNLLGFWIFDALFDVFTTIVILVIPVILVWNLQMRTSRKATAIASFGLQVPVCAFTIVRLVYLRDSYGAEDRTFNMVQSGIWTEISMHFVIIAANVPCIGLFLDAFNSTLWAAGGSNQMRGYATSGGDSAADRTADRKGFSRLHEGGSGLRSVPSTSKFLSSSGGGEFSGHTNGQSLDEEHVDNTSYTLSDSRGIRKTTQWVADYQPQGSTLSTRPEFTRQLTN